METIKVLQTLSQLQAKLDLKMCEQIFPGEGIYIFNEFAKNNHQFPLYKLGGNFLQVLANYLDAIVYSEKFPNKVILYTGFEKENPIEVDLSFIKAAFQTWLIFGKKTKGRIIYEKYIEMFIAETWKDVNIKHSTFIIISDFLKPVFKNHLEKFKKINN